MQDIPKYIEGNKEEVIVIWGLHSQGLGSRSSSYIKSNNKFEVLLFFFFIFCSANRLFNLAAFLNIILLLRAAFERTLHTCAFLDV